jgi:hypothetical protein
MISFQKPKKLNGTQLMNELDFAGIKYNDIPLVDDNDLLWLDIADKDGKKAMEIVKNHIGLDRDTELTTEEKLAQVGLKIEDLKIALGL